MKHNYHAHTPWSHHASISAEDSIKIAIKRGFKTFGFSEHINLNGGDFEFRLKNNKELRGYIDEITFLKEKYKKEIDIKIGIESEYRHENTDEVIIDWIKQISKENSEIEYFLLAGHFWSSKKHIFNVEPDMKMAIKYVQDLKDAVDSFPFAYLVHPDGWAKGIKKWNDVAEYLAEEITKMSAEKNIPLGLNANGLGYGIDFCYPRPEFFKIAAKNNALIILELDSHSERAIGQDRIDYITKMAKDTKVRIIDKLDI